MSSSSSSSVDSSSSSSSTSDSSSSSQELLTYGVTYLSNFRDINSINNPLIDNDVRMQYAGYFNKDWQKDELEFDDFGYGLSKTKNNQGAIFCNDASKLFSPGEGYVGMVLNFPYEIVNGVHYFLNNRARGEREEKKR